MDDVIVVGAGPTGLTAAVELARRGVPVRVLDAAEGPHRGSRAKGVQPRTLELLDQIGVADRLVSLGTFDLPIRTHAPDGSFSDRSRDPEPDTAPDPTTPWRSTLLVPQWRTEQVLRERLAEEGVEVEYVSRVAGLSQDDGGVDLVLEGDRRLRAAWVVGADGGTSVVRRQLGVGFLGETHEEVRLLLGDAEIDGLDRDHWHMWSAEGPLIGTGSAFFALCPLPAASTWQIQIAHADPDLRATPALLTELVDALHPRVRVRRVEVVSDWRLNVRMVEDYRVGRVFLAGDAAHVHSPAGAMGMNTGIGDAVNLAWKLAAVLRGADPSLLASYADERLPVAAHVLGLSSELTGRAITARTADQVRDAGGLGISYGTGERGPGPAAGDRAPDAPLVGGGSVFLRRREADWTVLAFGGAALAPPDLPAGSVQVLDADELAADETLRTAYAAVDGEVVVIRPDGYVWSRGQARTSSTGAKCSTTGNGS
ncbi:3-(3-hydroxyphenyl)propionate hydroxylase [Marmoricola endophyticus]|uniref:3-(3-hydroxyphenyl)propionate hydroxylase n=1 Tax=Marmoricola endophyticus TaxID=2040280 RepID=A0A917F3Z8_9ACTN|nr:FAD-dependent oxidoreductase [Marmoricola endophyticus]GGF48098.1 3-(3-hydroxyphenyl)propionate hydroxylase [Marmoricola endophyticus]